MKFLIMTLSLFVLISCSDDQKFRLHETPKPQAIKAKGCANTDAFNYDSEAEEDGSCSFKFCNVEGYLNSDRPYYNSIIAPYLEELQQKEITYLGGVNSTACENKLGCMNSYAINHDIDSEIENGSCEFTGCPEENTSYLNSFNLYVGDYPNAPITRTCNKISSLNFKKTPVEITATKVFSEDVEIEIKNILGMVLVGNNQAEIEVTAWLDNNCTVPANGNLTGTLKKKVTSGVAIFNDLKYDKVEDIYLRASNGTLQKCSEKIIVKIPSEVYSLAFKAQPTQVTATKVFGGTTKVEIKNILGMVLNGNNTAQVTLSAWLDNLCTVPALGNLTGTLTKTVVAGVATYSDLKFSKVEDIYLRAQTGNKTVCSNKVKVVAPSDIDSLLFKKIPSTIVATKDFPKDVEVEILNILGMVIEGNNTAQITLSPWLDDQCTLPATGNLTGTLTQTVSDGVATFDDLSFDAVEDIYLLSITGNISKCSEKITVTEPTDIEYVTFKEVPANVTATEIFSSAVKVEIKNYFETVLTGNNTAEISISAWLDSQCSVPTTGNLLGDLYQTVVSGVATFNDLAFDTLENIYLKAEVDGKSGCSDLIVVHPPTDIHTLHFIALPQNVTEGQPFNYNVKVELRNLFGMPLAGNNSDEVVISAWTNNTCSAPGMGTLGGTLTKVVDAGIATFSNLTYSANEDIYLKAESMGKTVCSNIIDVLPAPEIVTNTYTQMTNNKVDVILMIDNSGSMGEEIQNLRNNLNLFVQEFVMNAVDFKFVISSSVVGRPRFGKPHPNSVYLTKADYLANPAEFFLTFDAVLADISQLGGGTEVPYRSLDLLLKNYPTYRRADASLAVLVLGDEQEQSTEKTIQQWHAEYSLYYDKIQISTIINMVDDTGNRFKNMTTLTSGHYESIVDPNFHTKLTPIGVDAANLPKTFALTQPPVVNTIVVKLNGVPTTAYSYNTTLNVIIFTTAPAVGDTIVITYQKSMI